MTIESAQSNDKRKKRNIWLIIVVAFFLLAGTLWFLEWLFIGRFYISTQDAYIHGNEVMLVSQVQAGVKTIYADETDLVQEGQLILELDPSDFEIAVRERRGAW